MATIINAGAMAPGEYNPQRWRRATISLLVCSILSGCSMLLGLITKTVMVSWGLSVGFGVGTSATYISYYGADCGAASVFAGGVTVTTGCDLDSVTCGKAGAVRFAGALHFFILIALVLTTIWCIMDLKMQLPMALRSWAVTSHVIAINVMCLLQQIVLGVARGAASDCAWGGMYAAVYSPGACWYNTWVCEVLMFIAGISYVATRYCNCCCTEDVVVVNTGPMMVAAQPMVVSPHYAAPPPGYPPHGGAPGYPPAGAPPPGYPPAGGPPPAY